MVSFDVSLETLDNIPYCILKEKYLLIYWFSQIFLKQLLY